MKTQYVLPSQLKPMPDGIGKYQIDVANDGYIVNTAGERVLIHVLEKPVIKRKFVFSYHIDGSDAINWYYCDYDGDRIGYYEDKQGVIDAMKIYLTLTYGVQIDDEEFRMEL